MSEGIIIANVEKVPYEHIDMNNLRDPGGFHNHKYAFDRHKVSTPAEGGKLFVQVYSIPPGCSNYPYHYHTRSEEVFYIISGRGKLETPDGPRAVGEGDIIVMPVGEKGAHMLHNTGDSPLVYLDIDGTRDGDMAFYPRSGKFGTTMDGKWRTFRQNGEVNYLDGE